MSEPASNSPQISPITILHLAYPYNKIPNMPIYHSISLRVCLAFTDDSPLHVHDAEVLHAAARKLDLNLMHHTLGIVYPLPMAYVCELGFGNIMKPVRLSHRNQRQLSYNYFPTIIIRKQSRKASQKGILLQCERSSLCTALLTFLPPSNQKIARSILVLQSEIH